MLPAPLDTCAYNTQHRGNPASNSKLKLSQALNVYSLGIYTELVEYPTDVELAQAFHIA